MKKSTLLLSLFVFTCFIASAQKNRVNIDKSGLAIEGYDPVAYFTNQRAIEGDRNLKLIVDGVAYYFSSQQNQELFKESPSRYQPQYGGWCAYAMGASGEKVEVDPETFKLVDGKLYLFYNKFFNNTKKSWDKNESALKSSADANWIKIAR